MTREELEFSLLMAWHEFHPNASPQEHEQAAVRVAEMVKREEQNAG